MSLRFVWTHVTDLHERNADDAEKIGGVRGQQVGVDQVEDLEHQGGGGAGDTDVEPAVEEVFLILDEAELACGGQWLAPITTSGNLQEADDAYIPICKQAKTVMERMVEMSMLVGVVKALAAAGAATEPITGDDEFDFIIRHRRCLEQKRFRKKMKKIKVRIAAIHSAAHAGKSAPRRLGSTERKSLVSMERSSRNTPARNAAYFAISASSGYRRVNAAPISNSGPVTRVTGTCRWTS